MNTVLEYFSDGDLCLEKWLDGWLSFTRTTFISIDLQYTCCARKIPFALLIYLASFIYVSLIVIYLVIYVRCNYIYFLTFYRKP